MTRPENADSFSTYCTRHFGNKLKFMHLFTKIVGWNSSYVFLIKHALPIYLTFNNTFKDAIDWTIINVLKIPLVGCFYLIAPSKYYHVFKYRTIHLLDTKFDRYTFNTLRSWKLSRLFRLSQNIIIM